MAGMTAISGTGTKHLGNSESLHRPDVSRQVLAQSNLQFGRRCHLKNFKMAALIPTFWKEIWFEEFQDGRHCGHLGYRIGTILAILNFHVAQMPSVKFGLNPTNCSGADVV